MHPVIAVILASPPANTNALVLLERLLESRPDISGLIALEPELEQAVNELDKLSYSSKRIVEQCLYLKPQPSPSVPIGF